MKNVFEDLKSKFSSTDAQYLLGNALDQCWEGETEREGGQSQYL